MTDPLVTCPLCGFAFERADTLCAHGCPLSPLCRLVRCPGCGYEFPETPGEGAGWWSRLFGRGPAAPAPPAGVRALSDLSRGERARVVCMGGDPGRQKTLAVFGLAAGVEVTLLQQRPACVVRVDETELALDGDIAKEILVGA